MLRKYQHEFIVLVSLLILIAAITFKAYQHKQMESKRAEANTMIAKIEDVATMKKLWYKNKKISQKLLSIKSALPAQKIKKFQLGKRKATIILEQLNGSELNKITGKYLASIAIQITELQIDRNGKNYTLELRCKW